MVVLVIVISTMLKKLFHKIVFAMIKSSLSNRGNGIYYVRVLYIGGVLFLASWEGSGHTNG